MDTINVWSRASQVPAHNHDAHKDSKRPIFHPLAPRGWSSDPCGPILYRGRYHLFYQHQHASCQWYWGLCWDHVVSDDLVHWKNLPPAVVPTPGGLDADGCFSGTVEFDPELGVPVIIYTGVYLKTNAESVAAHGLPAPEHDPGTRFVEKQLAAVPADPDDPDLTYWVKLPSPVMALPPAGINISCWRDPFCLQRPAAAGGEGDEWVVLLASGIRGVGGAVLRFRSKHFTHGWEFDGVLANGDNKALGIRGQDWECPILAQLPCVSREAVTAAIAVSTAAIPAAIAAKLPDQLSLAVMKPPMISTAPFTPSAKATPATTTAGSLSSSSSGSSSRDSVSHAAPGTPLLKGRDRFAANTASLSSISGFGGSSLSLAAVGDDAASHSSGSSPSAAATVSSPGYTSSTGTTAASAATAAAAAIAAAGSATAAAAAADSAAAAAASDATVLALPLTEPALAAATSAAEAAPITDDDVALTHPAVSVDAWVQHQTQQQVVVAAAAADDNGDDAIPVSAESAGLLSADDLIPVHDDMAVVICADDDISSDGGIKQQQVVVPASCLSSGSIGTVGGSVDKRWWFCMSPDACNNPITWWMGDYDGKRFDIAAADGPHRLDLGTTLYAATLWEDPQGRQLLYGWIQEHRRVPTPPALCDEYSYAGCISTPRVLQLVDGQLWQTPLPDINTLRTSVCWRAQNLRLSPNSQLTPLEVVSGTHLDINLTLLPPADTIAATAAATAATAATMESAYTADLDAALASEGARAGLVFKSWKPDGKGAAVLSCNWDTGVLMFDFDEPFPDAYNPHPDDTPERRRVGGRLRHYTAGEPLSLRILLDGSAVEVFTSTGETLTTRMYRGHPPKCACTGCSLNTPTAATAAATAATTPAASSVGSTGSNGCVEDETGIALFSAGAAVTVSELCVWEMGSCWVAPSCPPPQPPALLQQQQQLAASRNVPRPVSAPAAPAKGGMGVDSVASPLGVSPVVRSKSEAAVHGLCADSVNAPAAVAAGADGVDGVVQGVHHAAGEQAVVKEAFLEELNILAK